MFDLTFILKITSFKKITRTNKNIYQNYGINFVF